MTRELTHDDDDDGGVDEGGRGKEGERKEVTHFDDPQVIQVTRIMFYVGPWS